MFCLPENVLAVRSVLKSDGFFAGNFVQSPEPHEKEQEFTIGEMKWKAVASKKKLVTYGESLIEKRMLCLTSSNRTQECCVEKSMRPLVDSKAMVQVAKARLRNF